MFKIFVRVNILFDNCQVTVYNQIIFFPCINEVLNSDFFFVEEIYLYLYFIDFKSFFTDRTTLSIDISSNGPGDGC